MTNIQVYKTAYETIGKKLTCVSNTRLPEQEPVGFQSFNKEVARKTVEHTLQTKIALAYKYGIEIRMRHDCGL